MRFFVLIQIIVLTISLGACSTDHNNDYLKTSQGPALKIPNNLSSYAMHEQYPIPSGATWHSDQPIAIYPPDSNLAKNMQKQTAPSTQTITMGVDAKGTAALNINKPYKQVWQQLPKALAAMGYRVAHADPKIGLMQVVGKRVYLFTVLQNQAGNTIISVRNQNNVALSDHGSKIIMSQLQQQLGKLWS